MMCTICSMIRDEQDYIDEWLEYHFNLGIKHIYLYNNGTSDYNLEKYDNVSLVPYYPNIHSLQIQADCFTEHSKKYPDEWTFYIDVDEYLIFDNSILNDYMMGKRITYIYSTFYNANGQMNRIEGKLQDRFTQISPYQEFSIRYIKCLVKNCEVDYFESAHCCILKGEQKMRVIPKTEIVYLKHYFTKSYQEWCNRYKGNEWVSKGQCDDDVFWKHNPDLMILNDI